MKPTPEETPMENEASPLSLSEARAAQETVERALFEVRRVIAGQDRMLERVLVCLLSGGHLLIEGVPGLAKTLTIKTAASVLGGTFNRIQFTPDLVPSDLVGTRVFRPDTATFSTEQGPVFCNFLLADEINRAPAKVQSALLEVMQEHQVTIGRETMPVPEPFLVMATQNPIESEGTYPLPEAQVDRFMLKVVVGYPDPEDELTVVERALDRRVDVRQVVTLDELAGLRRQVERVYVDPAVSRYAVALAGATRSADAAGVEAIGRYVEFGASPRGSIALVVAARALALIRGRDYVIPQDLVDLAHDVLRHRLVLSYEAIATDIAVDDLVDAAVEAVPAPPLDLVERAA
jgi:MoxR-like ATPase